MTPEGKIKAKIKDYLNALGPDCWYFMPSMTGYGRKGIPDVIGCYAGIPFAIEIKADGKLKTATPWQLRELQAFSRSGGIAMLVDSKDRVEEAFDHAIQSRT